MSIAETISVEAWKEAGIARYGVQTHRWRFRCPSCKSVMSADDYRHAGAPEGAIGFSCVGRWTEGASEAFSGKPGPCTYAGGGLIGINPLRVKVKDGEHHNMFDFADEPLAAAVLVGGAETVEKGEG